jgi:hypothetical protein
MNRRTLIKTLTLLATGASIAQSCTDKMIQTKIILKRIKLDQHQIALIEAITETLIPKTENPGASDLGIPSFVIKMLDDSYLERDQNNLINGLIDFENKVQVQFQNTFSNLNISEKASFLLKVEKELKKSKSEPKGYLYSYLNIRQQTLFGYTTSQYFMTKEILYELVPGRYKVHIPIVSNTNT